MQQALPKTLWPFFWYFIRPYKGMAITFLVMCFLGSVQTLLPPYLLKIIIDTLASYEGEKAAVFEAVKLPAVAYILVWLMLIVIARTAEWIKLNLFPRIRHDITNAIFSYLNQHSHSYLQNNFAGSLSNKIMDMASSSVSIFNNADAAVSNIFSVLFALGAMFLIHPLFSGILFVWVSIFVAITLFFNKKTIGLSEIFAESSSSLSGKIVDTVTNLTNVRLFARALYENKRLDDAITETVTKDKAVQWCILKMRIFWDVSFAVLLGSMLASLIFLYSKGKITVGDFAFVMTVAITLFMDIWNLADQIVHVSEDLGECSQALTITNTPHEIVDIPEATPLSVTKGTIIYDNVTFRYQRSNRLFQKKHVEISAGSKIGLVGFSGSGKTTFVNLILRFFEVDGGRILIDGQDISKVTQDSLHANISMIPQDTSLFHRSLMENIRYGRIDARDDEVIEASKRAHCHEFIKSLPEGYDTLVGERGIKVSGGQRQRIAIARAILKDAPILILDEATSALDSVTEKHIQESLHALMEGGTTIVIAHRLSTLSEMDRILVFDKGRIIEDGTQEMLLKQNGHYARMWHMQAGGFLPEKERE